MSPLQAGQPPLCPQRRLSAPFEPQPQPHRGFSTGPHVAAILLLTLMAGCARVSLPVPQFAPPAPVPTAGWVEEGIASWYGEPFHGRRTASGEVYDMEAMTAAHRTLPFGTVVQVQNLTNGRATTLRINDRGPFIAGRTLDVSRRAARELELIGPGTARIRMIVLDAPAELACWEIQAGAFLVPANAQALLEQLRREGYRAQMAMGADGFHRVTIGPLGSRTEAGEVQRRRGGLLLGCGVQEGG